MKRILAFVVITTLILLTVSCGTKNKRQVVADAEEEISVDESEPELDEKEMEEDCLRVLNRWNDAHNKHDINLFTGLYSGVTKYYGENLTESDILASKENLFAKYPDFSQYVDNVRVSPINMVMVHIYFDKHVTASKGGKERSYPSYLVILYDSFTSKITTESDEITDANLAKRAQKQEVEVTNDMRPCDLFNKSNVGKAVNCDYWSIVGNNEEGPLAAAMVEAAGGFFRIGFCGTLQQNYEGQPDTFYCAGHCSAGESGWSCIWVYNAATDELICIM